MILVRESLDAAPGFFVSWNWRFVRCRSVQGNPFQSRFFCTLIAETGQKGGFPRRSVPIIGPGRRYFCTLQQRTKGCAVSMGLPVPFPLNITIFTFAKLPHDETRWGSLERGEACGKGRYRAMPHRVCSKTALEAPVGQVPVRLFGENGSC